MTHHDKARELADEYLAKTYGIVRQDEWRDALIKFLTTHLQAAEDAGYARGRAEATEKEFLDILRSAKETKT